MLHDCISYYLYGHVMRCKRDFDSIVRSHKIHVGYSAGLRILPIGRAYEKIWVAEI
jgi:hypothetical protein